MRNGTATTAGTIVAWVAFHYLYQWLFGAPDWGVAFERSYFTAGGQIALWLVLRGEFKQEAPYMALNESASAILRECQEKLRLAAPKISDLRTREAIGGLAFMSEAEVAAELAEFRSQSRDFSAESFVRWRMNRV